MSPGPEQSPSYWLQQVTIRDDVGDLRLNLLSPPLQAPRQCGPGKHTQGGQCGPYSQHWPLLRLTLVRILAALFVSFPARTGRQNARGFRIMSSLQSTVQDA